MNSEEVRKIARNDGDQTQALKLQLSKWKPHTPPGWRAIRVRIECCYKEHNIKWSPTKKQIS